MDIRGVVISTKHRMVGILKTAWSAMVSLWMMLLKIIIVNGSDLMTHIAQSIKNLFVWILQKLEQLPVMLIIVEEYKKADSILAVRRAGLLGKLFLATVPLTILAVLVHLIVGLYNVLKVILVKLLKRG